MALKLMYITNNPEIALIAEKNGVDRIWIDLETIGKEERQKNMNTVKSNHSIQDIKILSKLIRRSEILVRINPWNENSKQEIEEVIKAGANRIMLPMWKTAVEVDSFLNAVNGRASTTLLLETKEAVDCLEEVLDNKKIEEIHIGLNDLHLSYGLSFMFELLTNGTIEKLCKIIGSRGIRYGFGGIAALGKGLIPAEQILIEHYRLGSKMAILSRSFFNAEEVKNIEGTEKIFSTRIKQLKNYERQLENLSDSLFESNRIELSYKVQEIVSNIQRGKL